MLVAVVSDSPGYLEGVRRLAAEREGQGPEVPALPPRPKYFRGLGEGA